MSAQLWKKTPADKNQNKEIRQNMGIFERGVTQNYQGI